MYESFYKLHPTPFRLTPDPHFFFASKTHQRGMAYLRFAFYQREGFVVVTGAPGTGKTELMLNLIEEIPQQKVTLAKIVSSNLDADALLDLVASSFGIDPANLSKGALLKTMENYFAERFETGKQALLIIDEAHNLSTKSLIELSMLSNFQVDEHPVLQCFLLGQQPLEQKLNLPKLVPLKQRVIASTRLTELKPEETRHYIQHRLSKAGWNNNPAIDDVAFSLIHQFTSGVPRNINALCNRVLLQGYLDNLDAIGSGTVRQVIDELQEEAITQPLDRGSNTLQIDAHIAHERERYRNKKHAAQDNIVEPFEKSINQERNNLDYTNNVIGIPTFDHTRDNSASNHCLQELPVKSITETDYHSSTSGIYQDEPIAVDLNTVESGIHNQSQALRKQLVNYTYIYQAIPGATVGIPANNLSLPALPRRSPIQNFQDSPVNNDTTTSIELNTNHHVSSTTNEADPESVYEIYGIRRCDDEQLDPLYDIKKSPTSFRQKFATTAGIILVLSIPALALHGWYNASAAIDSHHHDAETVLGADSRFDTAAPATPIASSHLRPITELNVSPIAPEPSASGDTTFSMSRAPDTTDNATAIAASEPPMIEFAASEPVASEATTTKSNTSTSQPVKPADDLGKPDPYPIITTTGDSEPADVSTEDFTIAPQRKTMKDKEKKETNKTGTMKSRIAMQKDITAFQSPYRRPAILTPVERASPLVGSPVAGATGDLPLVDEAAIAPSNTATVSMATPTNKTHPETVQPGTHIPYNDLSILLSRFINAYEDGNLQQMTSTFAKDINNNNHSGRHAIKKDYQRLFAITDHRQLAIHDVTWSKKKNKMLGEGTFYASIREKGATEATTYQGKISVVVGEESNILRIKKLDYDYE